MRFSRSSLRHRLAGRGQQGRATVVVLGFIVVAWVIGIGAVSVGRAVLAAHRATAAADLAALAGAGSAVYGAAPAQSCRAAAAVASANGAVLRECQVLAASEVRVVVAVVLPTRPFTNGLVPSGGTSLAAARAGPAPP